MVISFACLVQERLFRPSMTSLHRVTHQLQGSFHHSCHLRLSPSKFPPLFCFAETQLWFSTTSNELHWPITTSADVDTIEIT